MDMHRENFRAKMIALKNSLAALETVYENWEEPQDDADDVLHGALFEMGHALNHLVAAADVIENNDA